MCVPAGGSIYDGVLPCTRTRVARRAEGKRKSRRCPGKRWIYYARGGATFSIVRPPRVFPNWKYAPNFKDGHLSLLRFYFLMFFLHFYSLSFHKKCTTNNKLSRSRMDMGIYRAPQKKAVRQSGRYWYSIIAKRRSERGTASKGKKKTGKWRGLFDTSGTW